MFKIAICDDEKYFRDEIKGILESYMHNHGMIYAIDTFDSGKAFVELGVEMAQYRIVFLDINMEEMSGIAAAQRIREVSNELFIVFITAFVSYSLEGYKVDAVRYILKNVDNFIESINECMDVVFEKMNYKVIWKELKFYEGRKRFSLERLLYVESRLHKLEFHIMDEQLVKYTIYGLLDKVEQEIKGYDFIRIHKSFLVNMKYIQQICRYKAILNNGLHLVIPKARYKYVEEMFISYKGEV